MAECRFERVAQAADEVIADPALLIPSADDTLPTSNSPNSGGCDHLPSSQKGVFIGIYQKDLISNRVLDNAHAAEIFKIETSQEGGLNCSNLNEPESPQ